MATIRPFEPEDAAAVSALYDSVYPQEPWSTAWLAEYLREVFCAAPWRDPEIPSWVAHQGGRLVRFLGVMARPMVHRNEPVRAAVGCQFLVHPAERRGFAGIQLLQRYLRGPQDLSLADGANILSAKLWEGMGGMVSPLHSMAWIRVLRPAQFTLRSVAARSRWLRPAATLSLPFAALADACAGRVAPFRFKTTELREEALDAGVLHAALDEYTAQIALRPRYDLASLEWLLAQVSAKKRHGPLQARLLRDPDGRTAGWFLYYLDAGLSRVVQLAARPDRTRAVLAHLYHHASERGAAALEGRVDARFFRDLGETHCFFRACSEITLFQARDAAILGSLLKGDAFFTRLEGEWWLRFHEQQGLPAASAPAAKAADDAKDLAIAR